MSGVDDVDGTGVCGGGEMSSKPLSLLFTIFTFEVVGLFFTLSFGNLSSLKNLQVGIFMLPEPADLWLSLIFFKQRVKASSKFSHLRFSVSIKKQFEKMNLKVDTYFPYL